MNEKGLLQKKIRTGRRHFVIVLLLGFCVDVVEGAEHFFTGESLINSHFIIEVIIYGVGVQLLGLVLLFLVDRAEIERDQAKGDLDQHLAFSDEVTTAPEYEDLTTRIARFPRQVLPVTGTYLHIYDADKGQFQLKAEWSLDGRISNPVKPELIRDLCQECALANFSDCTLRQCSSVHDDAHVKPAVQRFMLPLVYGNALVALLHFDLPENHQLTNNQMRTLGALAPEMALAIETARLRITHSQMVEATLAERQRIARELHDSLGQSVAYLRLKLDQLTSQDMLAGIKAIRNDLKQMRDIANTAYDQVRGTLTALHAGGKPDLIEEIRAHAKSAGKRTNLKIVINSSGEPRSLSSHSQRQIIYICREALYNIEKHARAKLIAIELLWETSYLIIKIKDDGSGFDPIDMDKYGSFGIAFMHELAAEINATVRIHSAPNSGTEVTVHIPLSGAAMLNAETDIVKMEEIHSVR